jgi:hypothetical protein
MPLPTFNTKDEIPEAVRDGYIERNGKWVPEVDDSGLRDSHRRATEEARKLKEERSAIFGDRKPDEIAEILKQHAKAEEDRAKSAGEFDKLLEKRLAERDAEWTKKYDAVSPYKAKYEDTTLDAIIRKAAIPAGVDGKDLEEYVIPLIKGRRIKLDDAGKAVVLDKDGDPTGLTVEKFFTDAFKSEAPKFYAAAGGSGGGAGPAGGAGRAVAGQVRMTDNAAFIANLADIASGKVKAVA